MVELLHKALTEKIIAAYYKLYNGLSHSFPEFIFERAFVKQLRKLGIEVIRQDEYKVFFKEKLVGIQRLDLFVANDVVVELKVTPEILPIHKAQTFSYLKVVKKEIGLLFNFGSPKPQFERLYFDLEKAKQQMQDYPRISFPSDQLLYKPEVVNEIFNIAIEVHRTLGSGFIHRIYANASYHECCLRNLSISYQKNFQVIFDGEKVGNIKFNHIVFDKDILFFPVAIINLDDININNIKTWLQYCKMKLAILVNFWGTTIDYKVVVA